MGGCCEEGGCYGIPPWGSFGVPYGAGRCYGVAMGQGALRGGPQGHGPSSRDRLPHVTALLFRLRALARWRRQRRRFGDGVSSGRWSWRRRRGGGEVPGGDVCVCLCVCLCVCVRRFGGSRCLPSLTDPLPFLSPPGPAEPPRAAGRWGSPSDSWGRAASTKATKSSWRRWAGAKEGHPLAPRTPGSTMGGMVGDPDAWVPYEGGPRPSVRPSPSHPGILGSLFPCSAAGTWHWHR